MIDQYQHRRTCRRRCCNYVSLNRFFLFIIIIILCCVIRQSLSLFDYSIDPDSPEVRFDLIDVTTGVTNIETLFLNEPTNITVKGISWIPNNNSIPTVDDIDYIIWSTYVDDIQVDNGNYSLVGVRRQLPSEISCGTFIVTNNQYQYNNGMHNVTVEMYVTNTNDVTPPLIVARNYNAYNKILSLIPLFIVLLLAITTSMVEISLISAVFVGACMIYGNILDGFKYTLSKYLIESLSDPGHCYVILLTSFLGGLMTLMEKSGGMKGFTIWTAYYATTPNIAQLTCYLIGIFIFFDDYSNILLAGQTMKPLFDTMHISREKLAFIISVMGPNIVILSPISSWIGFEINLIQPEINRIIQYNGDTIDNIGIETTGIGIFFQSLQYQYYSIYMIIQVLFIVLLRHDFGWMLYAERKVAIFERKDGGDGKGTAKSDGSGNDPFQPKDHTPSRAYNMFIPIAILIGLVFYLMIQTGTIDGMEQTLMSKIEKSDSNASLLWGTMGASLCTVVFYLLQWYKIDSNEEYIIPPIFKKYFYFLICEKDVSVDVEEEEDDDDDMAMDNDSKINDISRHNDNKIKTTTKNRRRSINNSKNISNASKHSTYSTSSNMDSYIGSTDSNYAYTDIDSAIPSFIGDDLDIIEGEDDDENENADPYKDLPHPLISLSVAIETFFLGMATLYRALIVLVLAWAIGDVMVDVGADRLFTRLILTSIKPELLPTLTFLISFIIALSTGSAWGTMSMVFPLVLVPTYVSSDGDDVIFYAVTASILSGAVSGNNMSPISDTTVLTTMAADCNIIQHISTRTPYFIFGMFVTVVFGTLPVGYNALPNLVILAIGFSVIAFFVIFVCAPVWATSGRYDWFTELLLETRKDSRLEELRQDTILYFVVASIYPKDASKQSRFIRRYLRGNELSNDEIANDDEWNVNDGFESDTYFNSSFLNLTFLKAEDSDERTSQFLSLLKSNGSARDINNVSNTDNRHETALRRKTPSFVSLLHGDMNSFATKTASILTILKGDMDTETRTTKFISILKGNMTEDSEGEEEEIIFCENNDEDKIKDENIEVGEDDAIYDDDEDEEDSGTSISFY